MKELLSGIIGQVTNIIDKAVLDKDEAARLEHEISTMADRHAQELGSKPHERHMVVGLVTHSHQPAKWGHGPPLHFQQNVGTAEPSASVDAATV